MSLPVAVRRGSIEAGPRRSGIIRLTFNAGGMSLVPRHSEKQFRHEDLHGLCIATSDAALTAASHPNSNERAPEWIQPGGINRLAACLTQQAHGRYSAIRWEQVCTKANPELIESLHQLMKESHARFAKRREMWTQSFKHWVH